MLLAAGCETAPVAITDAPAPLPAGEDSAAFLFRVADAVDVTENDAMRGIVMLAGDGMTDPTTSFRQRVNWLLGRGIVDRSWDFAADRPITKGKLAYMICQAAKVKGGVVLTLTGPSQRYCLRELTYNGMMTEGPLWQPVPGVEYVAVLGRADTYKRTGYVPDAAGTVPGEQSDLESLLELEAIEETQSAPPSR